jgi:hypothetical protein
MPLNEIYSVRYLHEINLRVAAVRPTPQSLLWVISGHERAHALTSALCSKADMLGVNIDVR